jgi:putative transposase
VPQSLAHVLVHIIFSTKNRVAFLQSQDLRSEVHAYLVGTLRGQDCQPFRVGGVADHVHILTALSRKTSIADLVKNLKINSTKMIRNKVRSNFSWQTGYGAFSVSESVKDPVISCIANQETHHRSMTFQEEFRRILERHCIQFDERYLWD